MKERILIMEDETAIQSVLYELLTDAGYEVSLASDGLEGISLFQSQSFSLILLDIMMPKIDGYANLFVKSPGFRLSCLRLWTKKKHK